MTYKTEVREILCENRKIQYELTRKQVKNINLRIKPDGKVYVSANKSVPVKYLDSFVASKQDFIFQAIDKFEARKREMPLHLKEEKSREEIQETFEEICREIYPLFQSFGVAYPQIKIRTMKARWGSCHYKKGLIILNTRLIEAPRESIEFVVLHEFAHFIHPNHSRQFYALVESLMPDWKVRKAGLEKVYHP